MNIIENKDISLCDFINNIEKIKESQDKFEVTKVIKNQNMHMKYNFFKWATAQHDADEGLCPIDCCNCMCDDDGEGYDCRKIELNYYVEQWSTTMEGDSYSGNLVYPLKDYYIFVSFSC